MSLLSQKYKRLVVFAFFTLVAPGLVEASAGKAKAAELARTNKFNFVTHYTYYSDATHTTQVGWWIYSQCAGTGWSSGYATEYYTIRYTGC